MPATSVRERAVQAYIKAYPDVKPYKDKLNVRKLRSKSRIDVSWSRDAKISWSYKGGTLKRI